MKTPLVPLMAVAAASAPSTVLADGYLRNRSKTLKRLARCPDGGSGGYEWEAYKNNGTRCVRERKVLPRYSYDAKCPAGMSYKKVGTAVGKCYSDTPNPKLQKAPVKPSCDDVPHAHAIHYELRGNKCYGTCPKGTQSKGDSCIVPADYLASKYMTCPDGSRRVDAFCESEDHVECSFDSIPGIFYYRDSDGKCVRDKSVLKRVAEPLRKDGLCPETGQVYNDKGNYCQKPCPEHYRTRKGSCILAKCVIGTSKMGTGRSIICPEGTYANPVSLH